MVFLLFENLERASVSL